MQSLQVKILDERMRDQLPSYGTPGSAGLDLRACIDETIEIGLRLFVEEKVQLATVVVVEAGNTSLNAVPNVEDNVLNVFAPVIVNCEKLNPPKFKLLYVKPPPTKFT